MGSIESARSRGVAQLLIATAAMEFGAGFALLIAPAMLIRLLFGSAVDVFPAVGMARLAGAALLSLGAACWWARGAERSAVSGAIVGAMLIYNAAVAALVLLGGLGPLGALLWAVVVLHGGMGIWCAWIVANRAGSSH